MHRKCYVARSFHISPNQEPQIDLKLHSEAEQEHTEIRKTAYYQDPDRVS